MLQISHLFPELEKIRINKFKVHLAKGPENSLEALDVFLEGTFEEWQGFQSKKNFELPYIFSMIYIRKDEWVFGGIYSVLSFTKEPEHIIYQTQLTPIHSDLIGRVIINYSRGFRYAYPMLSTIYSELSIIAILREKISMSDFPGYENLILLFSKLKMIYNCAYPSWKTALSNMKGIYLITDIATGKMYVGAAYGDETIWNRWQQYITSGHGGNTGLRDLIEQNNPNYVKNFQFSLLEVHSTLISDVYILKRESHWKQVLLTRDFGYNQN